MATRVHVTGLSSRQTDDGPEYEITAVRIPEHMFPLGIAPVASDLPADVRTALATWLFGGHPPNLEPRTDDADDAQPRCP